MIPIGTNVRVLSGNGQTMTVIAQRDSDAVTCRWWIKGEFPEDEFVEANLVVIPLTDEPERGLRPIDA